MEALARRVGYCYQNPDHQIFSSTVKAEVSFGPKNLGMKGEELEKAVEKALEMVNLLEYKDKAPFELGRGQRQKLAVASILAMNSPVLVVDEPTTGMDLRASKSIMSVLADRHEEGKTIVVITHDMNIVAEYVPQMVVMAKGKILAKGPTREIMLKEEILHQAFLRPPQATRMALALKHHGIRPDVLMPQELIKEIVSALNAKKSRREVQKEPGE